MLVGDEGVGKRCLIEQYMNKNFSEGVSPVSSESCARLETIANKKIKLQLQETGGKARFNSIYRGVSGIFVVFDISRRQSFEHIGQWLEDVESFACSTHVKALIANKCDLASVRAVSTEEAQQLAKQNDMLFFETTASDHLSSCRPFQAVAREILEHLRPIPPPKDTGILRLDQTAPTDGCACVIW